MQNADMRRSAAAAAGEPDRKNTGIISTSVSRIRCSSMPVCLALWRSQRGLDAEGESNHRICIRSLVFSDDENARLFSTIKV